MQMTVRETTDADVRQVAVLRALLWPEATPEEHAIELREMLANGSDCMLVAIVDGGIAGFLEARLRSHADGCQTSPVGYLEGWYVAEPYRQSGVGRALFGDFEQWAQQHGCRELASDTWLDNLPSQAAHLRLGFTEVDRVITYRKALDATVELGPHARPPAKGAK